MSTLHTTLSSLEFAQVGWVVPDIEKASTFLSATLKIKGFPPPDRVRAQDLKMTYYGEVVDAEWLTTQTYNGGCFIELVQPISGKSMFHDYLSRNPLGGVQHLAYRLPVSGFADVIAALRNQGFQTLSEVDHPIARMAFFDSYSTCGVATEIMGVTDEGWKAVEEMMKVD